jgi:hypothetical protein
MRGAERNRRDIAASREPEPVDTVRAEPHAAAGSDAQKVVLLAADGASTVPASGIRLVDIPAACAGFAVAKNGQTELTLDSEGDVGVMAHVEADLCGDDPSTRDVGLGTHHPGGAHGRDIGSPEPIQAPTKGIKYLPHDFTARITMVWSRTAPAAKI